MSGVQAILKERSRQIYELGFDHNHDASYDAQELARAACCYVLGAGLPAEDRARSLKLPPKGWPWDAEWWKPTNPRRDLVKAGALCAAAIDQIDRRQGADPADQLIPSVGEMHRVARFLMQYAQDQKRASDSARAAGLVGIAGNYANEISSA